MTEDKWLFIGTDKRMALCSETMASHGKMCRAIETDEYSEELAEVIQDFAPHHIVFPIHQLKGTMPPSLIKEGTQLYVGVASNEWLLPFEQENSTIHRYLEEELFIWENARLTAEAFIAVYYAQKRQSIFGKHFYVAGYGRVGKMVVDVLSSLGGKVTVIARSEADISEAVARGFAVKQISNSLEPGSCLVNTIPAKWLSSKKNKALSIFDLASAPGCLAEASVPEYYSLLPGLPGKYFPGDAATALASALRRIQRG